MLIPVFIDRTNISFTYVFLICQLIITIMVKININIFVRKSITEKILCLNISKFFQTVICVEKVIETFQISFIFH